MNNGQVVKFDATKNFTYIKPLGSGGTGDTYLFKDETTDMSFAIKKYAPKQEEYIDDFYQRFVDEIKILFNLAHPNIVRIYNYYLFPEHKTGYLQMEYIKGTTIDNYVELPWTKSWDSIFVETISAFEYLEDNNILHRDIRPANIMIDDNDNVKIIDFGFGKKIDKNNIEENSIILNWPATEMPEEIAQDENYNEKTEIFFVETLFKHIIQNNDISFRYNHIIEKMVKISLDERYSSFHEITNDILEGVLGEIEFSEEDKITYRNFAGDLVSHIYEYSDSYSPINDILEIKNKLSEVIRSSSLELYLQNNSKLISCFISNGYTYSNKEDIKIENIIEFYKMLCRLEDSKTKIIIDNLNNRLSKIKVKHYEDDDLPF